MFLEPSNSEFPTRLPRVRPPPPQRNVQLECNFILRASLVFFCVEVYYFVTILRALWLRHNNPEQWKAIKQVRRINIENNKEKK